MIYCVNDKCPVRSGCKRYPCPDSVSDTGNFVVEIVNGSYACEYFDDNGSGISLVVPPPPPPPTYTDPVMPTDTTTADTTTSGTTTSGTTTAQ